MAGYCAGKAVEKAREIGDSFQLPAKQRELADALIASIACVEFVVAWIGDPRSLSASETLTEMAYAKGLGKVVILASPEPLDGDLWIACRLADHLMWGFSSRDEIVRHIGEYGLPSDPLLDQCESPIERQFCAAARGKLHTLQAQVEIGPYRVDFVVPEARLVIELDGHEFHKTKEQRTRDARRSRYLEREGWRVTRFTGSEVYADADKCVSEVLDLLETIEAAV